MLLSQVNETTSTDRLEPEYSASDAESIKIWRSTQAVYEEGKKDAKRDLSPTVITYTTNPNINDDYMTTCTSCSVNSTSQSGSDSKIIKTNTED